MSCNAQGRCPTKNLCQRLEIVRALMEDGGGGGLPYSFINRENSFIKPRCRREKMSYVVFVSVSDLCALLKRCNKNKCNIIEYILG